jgi:hypothetical protein
MEYTYYRSPAWGGYDWKEITKEEIDSVFEKIDPMWRERMENKRMFIKKGKYSYKAVPKGN